MGRGITCDLTCAFSTSLVAMLNLVKFMREAETEDITSTEENEMVSVNIINRDVIDQPVMTYCLTNA